MFGHAIVFVPLLALAMMILYLLLVFASHYFLTIVECTSHGQRQIHWPGESFTEWLGKPVHLVWLAGLYLLPAVLIAAAVGNAAGTSYVTILLTALAFAMLFPIGALSAFVARSVWIPLHPKAITLLLSKPGTTITFLVIGFTTCLVGLGGMFLAMFSAEVGLLGSVAGAFFASLAWFAYACGLGRLLFALTYKAPPPRKKRRKKPAVEASPPLEVETVPHWERPKPSWDPDRDETPYVAHEAEVVTKVVHKDIATPKESEMKLLEREPIPPPGRQPFGPDAFQPMTQNETMRNAVILAVMIALEAGMVRLLIDLNPTK